VAGAFGILVSVLFAVVQQDTINPYFVAGIGLAGAVIGGVLTSATTLVVERSRRKRDKQAAKQELRQAVRILLEELSRDIAAISHAARMGGTWSAERTLDTHGWESYRDFLAGRLSDRAWMWAATAYSAVDRVNDRVQDLRASPTYWDVDWLRDQFVTIFDAMPVIESELGSMAGIYRYTGYVGADELWPKGGAPREPAPPTDRDDHSDEEWPAN
jgi:hypothetical protein